MNKATKIFLDIVTPSGFEAVCFAITYLVIVADIQWAPYKSSLTNLQASDFKGTFMYGIVNNFDKFIKTHVVSDVMLYIFWLFIGALIYFLATRFVANASDMASGVMMRHYIWPKGSDANRPLKDFIEKLLFHLAIIVVLIIFLVKVPAKINKWLQVNHLHVAFTGKSLKDLVLLAIYLFIAAHIFTIILRLLFTRRRVLN